MEICKNHPMTKVLLDDGTDVMGVRNEDMVTPLQRMREDHAPTLNKSSVYTDTDKKPVKSSIEGVGISPFIKIKIPG